MYFNNHRSYFKLMKLKFQKGRQKYYFNIMKIELFITNKKIYFFLKNNDLNNILLLSYD